MPNLKILSTARRRTFNGVPKLSSDARHCYFLIDADTRKVINTLRTDINKVGFLMQRAYFQAKGRFFDVSQFKLRDQRFAEKTLGIKRPIDLSPYSMKSRAQHKSHILQNFKWKANRKSDLKELSAHALLHVDKRKSSEDVLFALLDFCWASKTEIPSYEQFSIIISASFIQYENTILERTKANLDERKMEALLSLLTNPKNSAHFGELKKIDQAHTQRALKKNAEILAYFRDIFIVIEPLLKELSLTEEATKYFADWVYKSSTSQIKQLQNPIKQCLYLAAFVKDQFYLRQDYAVDAFLKVIRSTVNSAKGYDRKQKESMEKEEQLSSKSVLDSAKSSKQILKLALNISQDHSITHSQRNEQVINLIESYFEAENPELNEHFSSMGARLTNSQLKYSFYEYLFKSNLSLQRSFGPLLSALVFDNNNSDSDILEAIAYYVGNSQSINNAPVKFLNKKDRTIVFSDEETAVISRYKTMLFIYIDAAIREKRLTLEYSYRYRASKHYLIPPDVWERDKLQFISAAKLDKYWDGESTLHNMGKSLTKTYKRVNDGITAKKNPFIHISKNGEWRIKDPEADYDASKYIPGILNNNKSKLLYEVLSEVDAYTGFSEAFTHRTIKGASKEIDKKLINATIMSLGTNLGHNDMDKAARNISEKQLRDTEKLWLSNENLEQANRSIVQFIQSLPLPTIYNDKNGTLHTSSDGKKVVVAVNSLLANYSYKYYGKEQGVSVNSFLDEKQSFFHVNVLTASDREAPHMMDGIVSAKHSLFREGESNHLHSTDTHGYSEPVFAGLHFLDVSFAPRIKNIHRQTIYAYEAKSHKKNSNYVVAPKKSINKKQILSHWDDILHLMASIKLGYCSASLIFKILSSTGRASPLYQAIQELGKLLKSHFILNYIESEELRKSIQKQLNRVELGQKLSGAVFFGRSGQLHAGTDNQIQKVMACTTLLKNTIILWNYLFLSDYFHGLKGKEEKKMVLDSIASGSVIAWKHLNMHGVYDFDGKPLKSFKATILQMQNINVNV
jgi:TnpA family transposase